MAEDLSVSQVAKDLEMEPDLPAVNIGGIQRFYSVDDLRAHQTDRSLTRAGSKRGLDVGNKDAWTEVGRGGKKIRSRRGSVLRSNIAKEKIEAYVTSASELPKQFAFALFLKENLITEIIQIKYINPFKIVIEFENELGLEKLISCQAVIEKGWRTYKPLEIESSYGVIRKVELILTEQEIMKSVTSSSAELLSVKRLMQRSSNRAEWIPSECVRLCFKGTSLPQHILVHGIRVRVEAYTFPVTQCSHCWSFGHTRKMCPRKKVVCPKCSKNHENCEATSYVCVNCTGNHLALSKKCPVYLKERRIRSIMANFNCSYRKALTMHVPVTSSGPPTESVINFPFLTQPRTRPSSRLDSSVNDQEHKIYTPEPSYASAVQSTIWPNNKEKHSKESNAGKNPMKKNKKKQIHSQKVNNDFTYNWDCCCSDSDCGATPAVRSSQENNNIRNERRRTTCEEKNSL